MSDSDSFISEVNDEVRRDRLFFLLKRYGWIAALLVVLIVGGAAWSEYRKAQERAKAQQLGDDIIAALSEETAGARQAKLEAVTSENPTAQAVVNMLAAAEADQYGNKEAAVAALDAVSVNGDVPAVYRQVAQFKSLMLQAKTMDANTRRQQLSVLAAPGTPLSLLAQEQLALMDVEAGNANSAIERYQAILQDAGVSSDLQQRALQVIVALGGTPNVDDLPGLEN